MYAFPQGMWWLSIKLECLFSYVEGKLASVEQYGSNDSKGGVRYPVKLCFLVHKYFDLLTISGFAYRFAYNSIVHLDGPFIL